MSYGSRGEFEEWVKCTLLLISLIAAAEAFFLS